MIFSGCAKTQYVCSDGNIVNDVLLCKEPSADQICAEIDKPSIASVNCEKDFTVCNIEILGDSRLLYYVYADDYSHYFGRFESGKTSTLIGWRIQDSIQIKPFYQGKELRYTGYCIGKEISVSKNQFD